ncbi:MAG: hypothetical protein Q8K58_00435 [Acidimicrobiales bacterium]|nr:hypothetical protein [Acidimicrobiales bacterium]
MRPRLRVDRRRSRVRPVALVLLAVAGAASLAAPGTAAEPTAGSAGVDTSLPPTESQVTVSGSGPFAALRVTVNQTQDLVNQAVSVTWAGGVPTLRSPSPFSGHYLQLMQCWGDDDGTNPTNPGPPPEQCVQGASDAVYGGRSGSLFPGGGLALERVISREGYPSFDEADGFAEDTTGYLWKPFRAVDGTVVNAHYDPAFNPSIVGGNYWLNPYFNSITTNEIPGGRTGRDGKGAELFEVTTGLESTGLGCGMKVQPVAGAAPKAPRCWLVIVPRGDPAAENEGTPVAGASGVFTSPLSPAAWQHRIAVPLDFTPIDSSCDLAAEQRRISGNELPVPAVTSWQQKLCSTPGLPPYAYGTVGDSNARQQLQSGVPGGPGMVVVSRAIDPSTVTPDNPIVYAPITLSATVIGFNVERSPRPDAGPESELLRGVRVAELNLTPRLVAKLLTQSYRQQTAVGSSSPPYDWVVENPPHLGLDPDFLRFNPEFELLENGGKNFGGLVMPSRSSDVAVQVWEWIFADPEAKAWLDGKADEWGMQVNPAYATVAASNSTGSAFGDPVPEQFPKSDPYCYEAPPQGPGGVVKPPPLCGTDWLPYTQSLRDSARLTRAADDGSRTSLDTFALTADKVYRVGGPQLLGNRTMLSVTDSASAVQYGVQTARLSRAGDDGDARTFVAPDEPGLTAGVAAMTVREGTSVLEPVATAPAPGAYPLSVLAYAAIAPLTQDAAARTDYAAFLDHAAGPGQVAGRELGQLPPGYTPLPAVLRAQAAAAARQVRELTATPPPADGPGGTAPDGSPTSFDTAFPADESFSSSAGGFVAPGGATAFTPVSSSPVVEPPAPSTLAKLVTPIVALAGNRFVLPVLAAIALLSGLGTVEITKRPRRAIPGSSTDRGVPA